MAHFKDTQNSSTTQSDQLHQDDYRIVLRNSQTSLKYGFTLMGKPIHVLQENKFEDSIHNRPIVCSYADMEFKMSREIQKDWAQRLSKQGLHLGYMFLPSTRQSIVQRMRKNIGIDCKREEILLINSMLTFYHLVVTQLTQKGEQIIIFTPTYYRFVYTIKNQGRQILEYELGTRQNEHSEKEFYIDFGELEKIFSENKIKLMVFANPHNPTGKIWSKQDMTQLKDLCLKYNCLIFSDDIFCDCIENPRQKYTSFLQFSQVHNHLIWAGSFGKAFNCSGNSFTYGIVENPQIRQKLSNQIMKWNLYPTYAAGQLLESCYTVGDPWRLKTIKYIEDNYALLKEEITKRKLKINVYKLESAFLPVLDFPSYKWPHSEIKKRLESQNIFPTLLETCYIERQKQSISCVRFNIAMNREILQQLIVRLQKALQN